MTSYFFSSTTRPTIPAVAKDDCIRQLFGDGNVFYSDQIGYGVGRFEFANDSYQQGTFDKSPSGLPVFTNGEYLHGNAMYRGSFYEETTTGFDNLTDRNGEIEWIRSGIRFNGSVIDDIPQPLEGTFTIPTNTTITYNKHDGVLSRDNNRWVARFATGSTASISGESFDIRKMHFEGEVTITFRDGCTFTGTEFDVDETNNPSVADVFTIPLAFNVTDASHWDWHQLNLWLLCQTNLRFLSVDFYDRLHAKRINCRQLLKFERIHFKRFGVGTIDSLLVLDALSQIGR
jgi:hypothetical protein